MGDGCDAAGRALLCMTGRAWDKEAERKEARAWTTSSPRPVIRRHDDDCMRCTASAVRAASALLVSVTRSTSSTLFATTAISAPRLTPAWRSTMPCVELQLSPNPLCVSSVVSDTAGTFHRRAMQTCPAKQQPARMSGTSTPSSGYSETSCCESSSSCVSSALNLTCAATPLLTSLIAFAELGNAGGGQQG